jgi:hypothetical protein
MLRKFVLPVVLLCGSFVMVACQPKVVSSEEPPTATAARPEPTPGSGPITIAAVGDIMLGSPFPNETRMPPNDGADLLKDVTPILSAADIAFGNLEGPIIDDGLSSKCSPKSTKCFAFRMPTRYGKYLKQAGFDVLSLANNHAGDFGDAGRATTRRVLDEQGIKHAGSDRHQFSSTILNVKGKRVALSHLRTITSHLTSTISRRRGHLLCLPPKRRIS